MKSKHDRLLSISAATLATLAAFGSVTRADIFQWEYINPANPAQGKQPSTTLCPDGVGVNAGPSADFDELNLTKAYLINKNLTGASAWDSNLSNADMSKANLMYADFSYATLSGANITG